MKLCNGCKQQLPNSSFYKKNDRGGLYSLCKKCKSARNLARAKSRYLKNPQIFRKYNIKRYYKNKEIENERRCKNAKKSAEKLDDSYILSLLIAKTKIRRNQVPPILVELKRLELLIKRPIERNRNEKR